MYHIHIRVVVRKKETSATRTAGAFIRAILADLWSCFQYLGSHVAFDAGHLTNDRITAMLH